VFLSEILGPPPSFATGRRRPTGTTPTKATASPASTMTTARRRAGGKAIGLLLDLWVPQDLLSSSHSELHERARRAATRVF
jgi:hypothetical protein